MVPAIGGTLAKLALDVTDQLPIYEKELNQLSVLEAPASTESTYANALSSARTDVRLLHQLYRAARAGNETKVHEIALEGSSAYSVAGTAMRRIGLTQCATSL
jgi:trans-aconitate methyltransferase